jgi:gluconate 2-dehydrogenase gamma chain
MSAGYFDEHQRATIEAAMARIIPTDDQPGAAEAGCIDFVDRYLSGIEYVYAKPDGSGFIELTGKDAAAYRMRIELLRDKYTAGIKTIDRFSQDNYGKPFRELGAEEQDSVLVKVEQFGKITDGKPAPQQVLPEEQLDFFQLLVTHTRQGFYADPAYGGNKDHVGWKLIGFPGPKTLEEAHSGRYSTLPYFSTKDTEGKGR